MNENTPPRAPMHSILTAGKAVMLMEPMADSFNDLLVVPPIRRVMLVAEAFAKASAANDALADLIRSSDAMTNLRTEGRLRGSGDVVVPKAFIPDFDRMTAREVNHG